MVRKLNLLRGHYHYEQRRQPYTNDVRLPETSRLKKAATIRLHQTIFDHGNQQQRENKQVRHEYEYHN